MNIHISMSGLHARKMAGLTTQKTGTRLVNTSHLRWRILSSYGRVGSTALRSTQVFGGLDVAAELGEFRRPNAGSASTAMSMILTDFGDVIAERIRVEHRALASRWFERLLDLL